MEAHGLTNKPAESTIASRTMTCESCWAGSRDQLLVQERRSLWERPFVPKLATFFHGSSSLKMKSGSKNLVTRLCLASRRSFERRIKTARNAISFAS